LDLDGILLIDKKVGFTSFETVERVRKKIRARKAGHSGTLDKAASGLLIVCINRGTVVQQLFASEFKVYRAEIIFGVETDTLDRYGRIIRTGTVRYFKDEEIEDVLGRFKGKGFQIPPEFSAIHLNGKRVYRKVLAGEKVEIAPREIEIENIVLLKNMGSVVSIEVSASKGTYIRALARDIASNLGTCGYVSYLRRIKIGPFSVEQALNPDEVTPSTSIIPLDEAIRHLPYIELAPEYAPLVLRGVPFRKILEKAVDCSLKTSGISLEEDFIKKPYGFIRVVCEGKLLAIVRADDAFSYVRVLKEP
jgi:tRNA pseudouridine55 synthase